jgi:hypothetical protein
MMAAAVPAVTGAATAAAMKRREDLMEEATGNDKAPRSTLNRRLLTSFEESRAQS